METSPKVRASSNNRTAGFSIIIQSTGDSIGAYKTKYDGPDAQCSVLSNHHSPIIAKLKATYLAESVASNYQISLF